MKQPKQSSWKDIEKATSPEFIKTYPVLSTHIWGPGNGFTTINFDYSYSVTSRNASAKAAYDDIASNKYTKKEYVYNVQRIDPMWSHSNACRLLMLRNNRFICRKYAASYSETRFPQWADGGTKNIELKFWGMLALDGHNNSVVSRISRRVHLASKVYNTNTKSLGGDYFVALQCPHTHGVFNRFSAREVADAAPILDGFNRRSFSSNLQIYSAYCYMDMFLDFKFKSPIVLPADAQPPAVRVRNISLAVYARNDK